MRRRPARRSARGGGARAGRPGINTQTDIHTISRGFPPAPPFSTQPGIEMRGSATLALIVINGIVSIALPIHSDCTAILQCCIDHSLFSCIVYCRGIASSVHQVYTAIWWYCIVHAWHCVDLPWNCIVGVVFAFITIVMYCIVLCCPFIGTGFSFRTIGLSIDGII